MSSFLCEKIWKYKQYNPLYLLIVLLLPIWHHLTLSASEISDCVFNDCGDAHIL